jgi:hypothetical protein
MGDLEEAARVPEEWQHLPETDLFAKNPHSLKDLKPFEEAEIEFTDSPGKKERIFAIGVEYAFLWYGESLNSETGLVDEVVNIMKEQMVPNSYRTVKKLD